MLHGVPRGWQAVLGGDNRLVTEARVGLELLVADLSLKNDVLEKAFWVGGR